MRTTAIRATLVLACALAALSHVLATPNPSAVYCDRLGYSYGIVETPEGQVGRCLADGHDFPAWDFFNGKVGAQYSYCARKGMDLEILPVDFQGATIRQVFCVPRTRNIRPQDKVPMLDLMKADGLYPESFSLPERAAPGEAGGALAPAEPPPGAPVTYPTAFSWKNYNGKNWVTSVRNQGMCGSCWAFAATAVFEAKYNIDNNDDSIDLNLSEQELVSDCSNAGSCCGGWANQALGYIKTNGQIEEGCLSYDDGDNPSWPWSYWEHVGCECNTTPNPDDCTSKCAYTSADGSICSDHTCANRCSGYESRDWHFSDYVHTGYALTTAEVKQRLYDHGPLAISVDANGEWSADYDGHIITTGGSSNHAVTLVGWDDNVSDPTKGYWIIKNSWGGDWGNSGYAKLKYGIMEANGDADYITTTRAYTNCNPAMSLTSVPSYTNSTTPPLAGHVSSACHDITGVQWIIDPYANQVHDWNSPDGNASPPPGQSFGTANAYDFNFTPGPLADNRYAVFLDAANDRSQHSAARDQLRGSFYVDTHAPSGFVTDIDPGWTLTDAVTLWCQDDVSTAAWSGCASDFWFYYDADGVCDSSKSSYVNHVAAATSPFTLNIYDEQRDRYLCLWVEDRAGNHGIGTSSPRTLNIDRTPPQASISGISPAWTTLDTISLGCTDPFGQCSSSRWYSLTDGSCSSYRSDYTLAPGADIQVGGDRTDHVCLWVEDLVGNHGTARSAEALMIDNTPPVAAISGVSGTWATQKSITLGCTDAAAGCKSSRWYQYTAGGPCSTDRGTYVETTSPLVVNADNNQRLCLWVEDNVGLHATVMSDLLRVDTTPPVASVSGVSAQWVASDTLALGCSDAASGCTTTLRYYFDADGVCSTSSSAYTQYTVSSSLAITDGHNDYLCLWVEDEAGNHGIAASAQLHVDVVPPTPVPPASQNAVTGQQVSFDGSASHDDVGIQSYRWDFGDGAWLYGQTAQHTYTRAGGFTVTLTVTDAAGNHTSAATSVSVLGRPVAVIDAIAPRPAIQGATIAFTGHGADQDGSIQAYEWSSDRDGTLSTAASFNTNGLSVNHHTITFKVRDNDGLWSDPDTLDLDIYAPPDWPMFHRTPDHVGSTASPIPIAGGPVYGIQWRADATKAIASGPAIADLDNNPVNGLEIVFTAGAATRGQPRHRLRLPRRPDPHVVLHRPREPAQRGLCDLLACDRGRGWGRREGGRFRRARRVRVRALRDRPAGVEVRHRGPHRLVTDARRAELRLARPRDRDRIQRSEGLCPDERGGPPALVVRRRQPGVGIARGRRHRLRARGSRDDHRDRRRHPLCPQQRRHPDRLAGDGMRRHLLLSGCRRCAPGGRWHGNRCRLRQFAPPAELQPGHRLPVAGVQLVARGAREVLSCDRIRLRGSRRRDRVRV